MRGPPAPAGAHAETAPARRPLLLRPKAAGAPRKKAAVGGARAGLRPERRHRPITFFLATFLLGSPGSWFALIGCGGRCPRPFSDRITWKHETRLRPPAVELSGAPNRSGGPEGGGRAAVWQPPSPHAQAAEAFLGRSPRAGSARRRMSAIRGFPVCCLEKGESAASAVRSQTWPQEVCGGGSGNRTSGRAYYLPLRVSEPTRTALKSGGETIRRSSGSVK